MRMPLVGEAAIAACVGIVTVSTLFAQRAAAPTTETRTALVSLASLTNNATGLKQSLDALKKEYEAKGASFKAESERGNQMAEQLSKLQPNSPEFKKLEREIFKLRADFELHGKRATEETQNAESKVYLNFSKEVRDEVARFAKASGVQLVLRYEPEPQELTDPRAILQEINKLVVYQRGLEVTPTLLEAMNRRTGTGAAPTAGRAPAARGVQR
jgi:Skp family chaperone for outer membrane proteins